MSCKENQILGLNYTPNAIDKKLHDRLMQEIDDKNRVWSSVKNKRRVYQMGPRYNYDQPSHLLPETMAITPLMNELIDVLISKKLLTRRPNQIIVNNYDPGEGINPHVDHVKHFDSSVASLSLLSSVEMTLAPVDLSFNELPKHIMLEPCSLISLSDDARYKWTHGIVARKTDHKRKRSRRVSITFRFVL